MKCSVSGVTHHCVVGMQRVAFLESTLPRAGFFFLLPRTVMTNITNSQGALSGFAGASSSWLVAN